MANQNGFWLAKCSNWLENGQWPPTVINSSTEDYYIHAANLELGSIPVLY